MVLRRVHLWLLAISVGAVSGCEACDPTTPAVTDSGTSPTGGTGGTGGGATGGDSGGGTTGGATTDGGADASLASVTLDAIEPLFVGAWREIPVRLIGVAYDDVTWEVVGGPDGGLVSSSKPDNFDPAAPAVMLLAGWAPGEYALRASHLGAVLAEVPFKVTLEWNEQRIGPPLWFHDVPDPQVLVPRAGSAWGDPSGMGVQNFNVNPRSGVRRVLITFVDFSDVRYPAEMATTEGFKTNWMNHVVNGVSLGGQMRSVAAYWNEVSGGRLTITAQAVGPVHMTRTFAQMFEVSWTYTDRLQALINDIQTQAMVDLGNFDVILMVTPTWNLAAPPACAPTNGGTEICDGLDNDCDGLFDSLDSDVAAPCVMTAVCGDGKVDAPELCDDGNTLVFDRCASDCTAVQMRHFAWPTACDTWGPFTLSGSRSRSFSFSSMPNDWTALWGREVYATYAHEFGHNIGLGDEYTPGVPGRNTGMWEMMHQENFLPHVTLSQRLLLGWVDPTSLLPFNPVSPMTNTLDLTPVGRLTPAAGEKLGVEIRVAAGWNYYWEYRLRQPGHIGDHDPGIPQMAPGVLLGTDRITSPAASPIARPPLLLVPIQAGSDGPALATGQQFEQRDPPARELRVRVNSADANRANVTVEYGTFKADPALRPWNPPPWQSESIEVRNAKSIADPAWRNVPWVGKLNTLVAKVENAGTDDAPGVVVDFYVKNYNAGGDPPGMLVGSATVDVPRGATVEALCTDCWTPPAAGHFCVEARIPLYQNPMDLTKVEATEHNNVAQSNYDRFYTAASSPAARVETSVEVRNPTDKPRVVHVNANQTQAGYRTYLETTWVRLEPGESRPVRVLMEFEGDVPGLIREQRKIEQNVVNVSGNIINPDFGAEEEGNLVLIGGATMAVQAALATRLEQLDKGQIGRDIFQVVGRIVPTTMVLPSVNGGQILLTLKFGDGTSGTWIGRIDDEGGFTVQSDRGEDVLEAEIEYTGNDLFAGATAPVEL